MLMSPDNRTVQVKFFKVSILGQFSKYAVPNARLGPAAEALVNRIPNSMASRQITPRTTCPKNPENPFDE